MPSSAAAPSADTEDEPILIRSDTDHSQFPYSARRLASTDSLRAVLVTPYLPTAVVLLVLSLALNAVLIFSGQGLPSSLLRNSNTAYGECACLDSAAAVSSSAQPVPAASVTSTIEDEPRVQSAYDVSSIVAWKRSLRQSAAIAGVTRQSHTAVCINFNRQPMAASLATVLRVQSQLHRYITIVSPVPLSDLPVPLPAGVRYSECAQDSVLAHDKHTIPSAFKGAFGTLQHVCAAACFDYYASQLPRLRGVIWQADDMFVNYTELFLHYPSNKSWAPSHGQLFHLTNQSMYADSYWTVQAIGNLFSLRHTIDLLRSKPLYRDAWQLAFGSPTAISEKAIADFFYLPQHQLRTFVDITNVLRYSKDEFVTVPDTRHKRAVTDSITVRVGLSMSEWWLTTQLRLTAAVHVLQVEPQTSLTSGDLSSQLLYTKAALVYLWGAAARNNLTAMHDYCFHTRYERWKKPPALVHPIKLSMPEHNQLYLDAYQRVREAW